VSDADPLAESDQVPALEHDENEKDEVRADSAAAALAAAALAAANKIDAVDPRVKVVNANAAVPADANPGVSTDAALARPERHAVPVERNVAFTPAGEAKPDRGRHGGDHTDLGADAPADAEIEAPRHAQVSKRLEFARALQAGIEIAAPTPLDRNPIELAVSARTAVPIFAATMAAVPRARPEAPAVIGAPTPPTPAPLTIMASAMRDMTTTAFRLSATDVPAPSSPADIVGPQIIQSLRVAWSRGVGEARIRLDPRQFGDVSVSLRVEAGQVVARVQADAPAVREWLQSNQRTLQVGLAEHQLRLGRLEVVAPGDEPRDSTDSEGRHREDSADEPPARRHRRRESTGSFDVVA
jgi:flagellar hook-length control protein FliK